MYIEMYTFEVRLDVNKYNHECLTFLYDNSFFELQCMNKNHNVNGYVSHSHPYSSSGMADYLLLLYILG